MPYQVAALGAAFSWSIASLIAAEPARRLGGPRFTRIRMIFVAVMLVALTTAVGQWGEVRVQDLIPLGLSSIIGLAIGDAALFTAMSRIGPRRTSMVFTANAPLAGILGALFLGEEYSLRSIGGALLVIAGVTLAIAFGTSGGQQHRWEDWVGPPAVGIGWAVLGASCQAVGAVIFKPVLDDGVDVIAVATVRVLIALPLLWIFAKQFDQMSGTRAINAQTQPMTRKLTGILIVSGLFGMVIGMTLLIEAISGGNIGIATVLAATTPILMLPLLWITTKERPSAGSWLGACLAIAGSAVLV